MASALFKRHLLRWTLCVAAALMLLLAAISAALEAGYLRHPLMRFVSAWTGRHIQAESIQLHILSRHPRFTADHVIIGNPSWMPQGTTASIDRLTVDMTVPGSGHWLRVDRLAMDGASLSLFRDSTGRANWQLHQKDQAGGGALPLIRSLSMPNAHAILDDDRRHLRFDGSVSARDPPDNTGTPWLHIDGAGQLNGASLTFAVIGDPLALASRDRPYRFTFSERSHPSRLSGRGELSRAFDFTSLETDFEADGENLKDLYLLVGLNLINTGAYHLSGKFTRAGTKSSFTALAATSGISDMSGTVLVDSSGERPRLTANLSSNVLRLADLGQRAARHESLSATPPPFLLSSAAVHPAAVRHGDAMVNFHAKQIDASRVSLHNVSARLAIDHGVMSVSPLTADLLQGTIEGKLRMDASSDEPSDDLSLQLNDVQIGQLDHNLKGPPRFEASLNARIGITGHGSSLHQIGASANGRIMVMAPRGTVRESLAELTGEDLRGLGLLFSRSQRQSDIRCAVADFDARDGVLTSRNIIVDTDDVLITGDGSIRLEAENLHLTFTGHPKQMRILRMSAPIVLSGTLRHPTFGLEHPKSVELIDRGTAKNADCASLLAQ